MNRNQYSFFFCFCVTFWLIVKPGNSLRCYECNSHTHKACALPKPPSNFTRECEPKKGPNYQMTCRKIVQYIDFEVNGSRDSRIIRSCAYEKQDLKKCYEKTEMGGMQTVCACITDECNASTVNQFSLYVLSVAILIPCYVMGKF